MKPWSQDWLIAARAYPGFCSIKRLGVFLLPLDGMLVHRRSLPSNLLGFPQQFASTHLYSWVERGTVRVKCLAQEHNTMSPARARTWTAQSGDECTNHAITKSIPESGHPCLMPRCNAKKSVAIINNAPFDVAVKVLTHCIRGMPNPKVSRAFRMKFHSKLLKALLKSRNNAMAEISNVSLHEIISAIKHTFCLIKRPLM